MKMQITKQYVWEKLCNLVLILIYIHFAYRFGMHALATYQLSSILLLITESACIMFVFSRSIPKEVSVSVFDWFVALAGTWLPLLFIPISVNDIWVGQVLQVIGVGVSLVGLLSLNKSFGIVPANRGVKTDGLYKIVRHPLYMGYIIMNVGFILNHYTLWNILLAVAAVIFLLLRAFREEAILSKDEEYRHYMTQTKWRVIPGVF